jgi:branched-chain amino acid transport system ATP-binding protein
VQVTSENILEIQDIEVAYNSVIVALKGVSLNVPTGKVVALLGSNGSGKSTTLKAVSRIIEVEGGVIKNGVINFRGENITKASPYHVVQHGLVQVLEGRHVFPHLTVEQNLTVPGFARNASKAQIAVGMERIWEYFPRLRERRKTLCGYTSGGEQQMVAIGRALMTDPALILLDEPSMGLAPQVIEEIFEIVGHLNQKESVSFLVAEQNTAIVLEYAHYAAILETGRIVLSGTAADLSSNPEVKELYLGKAGSDGRRNIREWKRYHRRKQLFL